jgi:hypothetical protein
MFVPVCKQKCYLLKPEIFSVCQLYTRTLLKSHEQTFSEVQQAIKGNIWLHYNRITDTRNNAMLASKGCNVYYVACQATTAFVKNNPLCAMLLCEGHASLSF